jgi:hypothetical protein
MRIREIFRNIHIGMKERFSFLLIQRLYKGLSLITILKAFGFLMKSDIYMFLPMKSELLYINKSIGLPLSPYSFLAI